MFSHTMTKYNPPLTALQLRDEHGRIESPFVQHIVRVSDLPVAEGRKCQTVIWMIDGNHVCVQESRSDILEMIFGKQEDKKTKEEVV